MADRRKPKRPYIETLDATARQRYIAKTSTIGNLDPYTIDTNRFSTDASILPSVSYPDIVNFLLYSPSPYTLEDLRCYKGLAAYNQFVNGWVRDVRATVIDGYHLVLGRVMHSQRLSDTPLKPWVIAEKCGKINSCHCDCVAGLGETCTHVSALLFYVDTKVRIRDSATVTESAAYWKLPASVRGASYLPAFDVDFTSSKTKKKQLDSLVGNNVNLTTGKRQIRQVEAPSQERVNSLFEALKIRGSKAAVLRVVPGYSEDFVPDAANPKFPSVLTDLYSGNFTTSSLDELINKSEEVTESISVTKEEARSVEEATRPQSKTKLWNKFRSGRLTASKIKKVCRTSIQHPSRSLIQSVCYPGNNSFANNATKWGLEHEETAKKAYLQRMEETHDNFRMTKSGFVINPKFPLFGASPDALVSCDCCGSGVLEVKCPYSGIGMSCLEYAESAKNPCVMKCGDSLTLGSHHDYMYQVQCQMHVCEVDYADFVVWTDMDMHIERVEADQDMWCEIREKGKEFSVKCVFPELLGKHFSKSEVNVLNTSACMSQNSQHKQVPKVVKDVGQSELYCFCKGPEENTMIACDNENCAIEWFHISCVNLKRVPKGRWFCSECRSNNGKSLKCSKYKN